MLRRPGQYHRGILVGPTAMGKTLIIGGIIDKFNCPKTFVITPTKDIMNQLINSLNQWFPNESIGQIGNGVKTMGNITVALFQSLNKMTKEIKKSKCELIIIDEVSAKLASVNDVVMPASSISLSITVLVFFNT